jgi:hypothetical protein
LANLMCSIGSMTTARRTFMPIIAPYEAKTPVAAYRERPAEDYVPGCAFGLSKT